MRKLMMTATLLLFATTFALAQPGRGDRGHQRADLLSELNLTAEQQAQIKTIRTEARAKFKPADATAGERPSREEMQKMRQETRAAIEAVLTPAQREQLEKMNAGRKAASGASDRKALRTELQEYRQKEVLPVLKTARGQLEQLISGEDKATLEELRRVFATRPGADRMDKPGQTDAAHQRLSKEEMEAKKAARETWRATHAAEIATLKNLVTKYQADLQRIHESLQPQQDRWQKDQQKIMQSYRSAEGKPPSSPKHERMMPRKKGPQKQEDGKKNWPKAGAFLLMKP